MKQTIIHLFSFVTIAVGLVATSASAQVYYGDSVSVGKGWIRTYVDSGGGVPDRIGLQMSADAFSAFSSLPESATILALPTQAPAPFNHVVLDWNPEGHPGPGYDAPHFDFHFYFSTPAQVAAIPFSLTPDPVDPKWVAPSYVADSVVVPAMGLHYFDVLAPEFNGGAFTQTFIYGYNKGALTFLEPMITYSTLLAGGNVIVPVRQPGAFAQSGYYPTDFGFSVSGGVYDVFVGGLTPKTSPVPEPASYGIIGAAILGGIILFRRRSQKAAANG